MGRARGGASRVIVGSVRSQKMAKMPLAEHDNVVKTFPPDRTDRHGDRGALADPEYPSPEGGG